jgi:hypothetical protein
MWNYLGCFLVMFAIFDFIITPTLCLIVLPSAAHTMVSGWALQNRPLGYAVAGATIFAIQNVQNAIMVFVVLSFRRFKKWVLDSCEVTRVYTMGDFIVSPSADRPHEMSFGNTKNTMELRSFSACEVYTVRIESIGFQWACYSQEIITDKVMSWSAFTHSTAPVTLLFSKTEFMSRARKNLSKCGYVDWNRHYMTENKIISNTLIAIEHYYDGMQVEDTTHGFQIQLGFQWPPHLGEPSEADPVVQMARPNGLHLVCVFIRDSPTW